MSARARGTTLAVLLAALIGGLAACGRETRPDVVLIVLDTVRADHLSLYGYPRPTTPHLDAFAAEAVVYETAIAAGTWTPPSHASLFTGMLPSAHGVVRAPGGVGAAFTLHPDLETLPERLAAAGWDTAAFVANRGYLAPVYGFTQGFARYENENLRPGERLVARLSRWLRHRARRPAFVFVNFMDAHERHAAPAPWDRFFPGARDGVDDVVLRFHATGRLPDPAETAHTIAQYDGEIRYLDEQLGALFALLRHTRRFDDALVLVTADHGQLFGEHGAVGHGGKPYHALVHVPLVVRWPHAARRGRERRPVSLADVPAIVLGALEQPPLGPPGPRPVLAEEIRPDEAIRALYGDDGHVLFEERRGPDVRRALFDLGSDPAQEHPLPVAGEAGLRLAGTLDRILAELPPPRPGPVAPADRALEERLRALGYLR